MEKASNQSALTERLVASAHKIGFDIVGIAPIEASPSYDRFRAWLRKGYHGEMGYLARPDAVSKRENPALVVPEARTVISVGACYHTGPLPPRFRDDPARGLISSYAWGDDYHDTHTSRLRSLARLLEEATGSAIAHRVYTDTGPILEREVATGCGLGFVGKNTNLIHPHLGSWLLLAELLVSVELPRTVSVQRLGKKVEPSVRRGTCGECSRCLDACPTGALVAPYVLDARRCISYLTIELKGSIPLELRSLMGNRIFGCDICQEVCPWNRRSSLQMAGRVSRFPEHAAAPYLLELLDLDEGAFIRRFGTSPIRRVKRRGLLRNACVAAGNWGSSAAVPLLTPLLRDAEPLAREHAAWALHMIESAEEVQARPKPSQAGASEQSNVDRSL